MVTVFFVRHGPTDENIKGIITGQQPGQLLNVETEHYIAGVAPLLRRAEPKMIFSSDLKRAVLTRRILKEFLQLEKIEEVETPLLRERSLGSWEGKLWKDIPGAIKNQRQEKSETYNYRPFGGENHHDVCDRVRAMIEAISKQEEAKTICCVTHSGWLRQLAVILKKNKFLPDDWIHRRSIYQAKITPSQEVKSLVAIRIDAHVSGDDVG